MKLIFKVIILIIVIRWVDNIRRENNLTYLQLFSIRPEVLNQYKPKTSNNPKTKNISQVVNKKRFNSDNVTIIPLGDVDDSDITDAVKIIKNFYGYNCHIGKRQQITNDMYIKNTDKILDADYCINKFYTMNKTIYIVDKQLWAKGDYLRGYALCGGGTVFVRGEKSFLKETIIHELGHTLGLGHCGDKSCIMAIENDLYDSGDFCNNCKRKLNIYE